MTFHSSSSTSIPPSTPFTQLTRPLKPTGKTLRRVLRELLELECNREAQDISINIPATIEDESVIEVAREKVKEYFRVKGRNGDGVGTENVKGDVKGEVLKAKL